MGLFDKVKQMASDPENQRKAKEAAQKFQDKRAAKKHHAHGRGHHTGHRGGFGGHDEHEEEDEVVYIEEDGYPEEEAAADQAEYESEGDEEEE